MGGVGGPCDYCVSPSPKNWVLGIFRLGQDFWDRTWDRWDGGLGLGLGLDNKPQINTDIVIVRHSFECFKYQRTILAPTGAQKKC